MNSPYEWNAELTQSALNSFISNYSEGFLTARTFSVKKKCLSLSGEEMSEINRIEAGIEAAPSSPSTLLLLGASLQRWE